MSAHFIAYYRVSTQRQGRSGLGLEAQREAVSHYVADIHGSLVEEHVEVESGKKHDRPILAKALAACRRTGATLVIAKLDRLARSVHFISGLMESRVGFVAVDMPAATPLMLHMIAAFSEYERHAISQRTKVALAAAKARGVRLGSYGATLAAANKSAATDFAQALAPVLEDIRSTGGKTLRDFADGLNGRGMTTREGSLWTRTTVCKLLARLKTTCGPEQADMVARPSPIFPNNAMAA